jgi:hypothetical protein
VAAVINARRADWARNGLTAQPSNWLDEDTPWPYPLTTNRTAIRNPHSVGITIRNGDEAAAQLIVYARVWADADYVRFAENDARSEHVEVTAPAAVEQVLDRITRHLTSQ